VPGEPDRDVPDAVTDCFPVGVPEPFLVAVADEAVPRGQVGRAVLPGAGLPRVLEGQGLKTIAESLTRDGIPSPAAYDPGRNSHRCGIAWAYSAPFARSSPTPAIRAGRSGTAAQV
jgi:hypothetical protein